MLGRKPSPVIGTLTGSMVSGTKSQFDSKTFGHGGVGLGIVAALDRRTEIPANRTVFSRSITGSSSIAVKSPRIGGGESSDEYKSGGRNTKMYDEDRNPFRIQNGAVTSKRPSVFHISPLRSGDFDFPASDFLSSCNLCRRKLHNEDIYMYRGEKAFCSEECRHKVIVTDERSSSSESSSVRAVEVASPPPCVEAPAYTAGILAI